LLDIKLITIFNKKNEKNELIDIATKVKIKIQMGQLLCNSSISWWWNIDTNKTKNKKNTTNKTVNLIIFFIIL